MCGDTERPCSALYPLAASGRGCFKADFRDVRMAIAHEYVCKNGRAGNAGATIAGR